MTELEIAKPITLPCGLTLPNRLAKAAMAESWGDKNRLPRERLIDTYSTWADGGWGMVLTGNVQIDVAYLGTPEDHAINPEIPRQMHIDSWKKWSSTANKNSTPTIVQLNHPGRQSTPGAGTHGYFGKTVAPSSVAVRLGDNILARIISALVFGVPREMTEEEIRKVVQQFADGARIAHESGFAGIQVHAAHGYLLAQFLSAKTNRRTDDYGGSPKKRAKIVVEVIEAIRKAVPAEFCVGIKLNSVDHQSREALDECIEQLEDICGAGIDFLEISGGTYENPVMMTGLGQGNNQPSDRTVAREAFFLEFAKSIRQKFRSIPLMVTGGFRTRKGMEAAVREGDCDIVGIARPAVLDPSLPKNTIFNKNLRDEEASIHAKAVPASWLSSTLGMRAINGAAETLWYVKEIHRILINAKL